MSLPPEVESRTQGSRPRTQKKSEAKDTKEIQGQGQTLSRPRTGMLEAKDSNVRGQGPRTQPQVFSKKKKVFKKVF